MNPIVASNLMKRMAEAINRSTKPNREAISSDLRAVNAAVNGDKSAEVHLLSKLASKHAFLSDMDLAFAKAGFESPQMKYVGSGVFRGKIAGSTVSIKTSGSRVLSVNVNNRTAINWNEVVKLTQNPRIAGPSEVTDPMGTVEDVHESYMCRNDECGASIPTDTYECPKCGADHVECPGCEKKYMSSENENDHCPLCGYSSWGLSDDNSEELNQWFIDAVNGGPKNFKGMNIPISVNPSKTGKTISLYGETFNLDSNDADGPGQAYQYFVDNTSLTENVDEYLWKNGLL